MRSRRWKVNILIITSFFLFFSFFISHFSFIDASDPEKELKKIQKKLVREKRKIRQTIKKEKSILTELEKINRIIRKKREEIKYYNNQLSKSRLRAKLLKNDITSLNKKLKQRKQLLKKRLRSLYKQQRGEVLSILVSAEDYQDFIRKSRYISFIAYSDSKLMQTYSYELKDLEIKMKRMEIIQAELFMNKKNVRNKTGELRKEHTKKKHLLASVKSKRLSYEKMVEELEKSSKGLREMIEKLKETKLPSSIEGKGFRALKGRLPWPIKGKILLPFGKYTDPEFNIPTFSKGLEIGANIGNTVLAVSGGRVVYAQWFKGYGLLLIINHGGGYHTLYAHLLQIFHKTGDIIKRRQAVGKVGESGLLNTPSLYFEIRYKGKPVNPLAWLRKKKK